MLVGIWSCLNYFGCILCIFSLVIPSCSLNTFTLEKLMWKLCIQRIRRILVYMIDFKPMFVLDFASRLQIMFEESSSHITFEIIVSRSVIFTFTLKIISTKH